MALKGLTEAIAEIKTIKGKAENKGDEAKSNKPEAKSAEKAEAKPPGKPPGKPPEKAILLGLGVKKIALLAALVVAFTAGLLLFTSIQLHFTDLINPVALPTLAGKLLSPNAIAFLFLYCLSISLASLYGYRSSLLKSLLAFLTFVPAAGIGALAPSLFLAFLALAASVSVAAVFASRKKSLGLGASWSLASKAVLLFMVLAFLIVAARAQADKEAFTRGLVNMTLAAMPQLQQQAVQVVSGLTEAIPLDNATVKGMVTRENVESMLAAQYDAVSNALAGNIQSVLPELNLTLPRFEELSTEQREKLVNDTYEALVKRLTEELPKLRKQLSERTEETLKKVTMKQPAIDEAQVVKVLEAVKQSSPLIAMLLDLMVFIPAFSVATITWLAGWPIKIISMLLTWLPAKILF